MSERSMEEGPFESPPASSGAESDSPIFIDELMRLRARRNAREKRYRADLRREIAEACALGVKLSEDEPAWLSFCLADWSGIRNPPELHERKKAVFFALKYMCGPGNDAQRDASFYFGAVDHLVRDGLLGDELCEAIERLGGLKALNDKRRAQEKKPYLEAVAALPKTIEASDERHDDSRSQNQTRGGYGYGRYRSNWTVEFPFYPSFLDEAGKGAVLVFQAQVLRFGDVCAMKVLKFQTVQKGIRRKAS